MLDFQNGFVFLVKLLYLVGVWPNERPSKIYRILTAACFTILNLHVFCMVMFLLTDKGGLEVLGEASYPIIPEFLTNVKLVAILMYKNKLEHAISSLNKSVFQPKNEKQLTKMLKFKKLVERVVIFYWASWISSLMVWSYIKVRNGNLPFYCWFPFDFKASMFSFILACVLQLIGFGFGIYTYTLGHVFVYAILLTLYVQVNILIQNTKDIRSELRNLDFENCLILHQEILIIYRDVRECVGILLLSEYLGSLSAVCLGMFVISNNAGNLFAAAIFCTSVIVLFQLYAYCRLCQEVIDKGEEFVLEIKNTDWVDSDPRFRKNMLYALHFIQEPLTFSAMGFFDFSIESFSSIMSKSYSFCTLLQQVK